MKTKKFFVALVATMICGNMFGQTITANDVTIEKGKTAEVAFAITADRPAAIAEFKLNLPEGITVKLNEDKDDYVYRLGGAMTMKTHAATIKRQRNGAFYMLVCNAYRKEFKAAAGNYLTVTLEASDNAMSGSALMRGIILGDIAAKQMNSATESRFNIVVNEATGINSIEADNSDAPAFNLAGQKVNKGYKGVVIMNGKKVVK